MHFELDELVPTPQPLSTEPWEVSVAELVRRTGKVPRLAAKPLELFDRFGAVRITPDEVGFDNDEVAWDKVTELRTYRLWDLLTEQSLEEEVDRIRGFLPPIPGRKWAVEKVVGLMMDLVMAVAGDMWKKLGGEIDKFGMDQAEERDGRIVATIVHKGMFGRTKEVRGGLVAALVLAGKREADDCIRQMAAARGIPVVASEEIVSNAVERGDALRNRFDSVAALARKIRGEQPAEAQGEAAVP